MAAPRVDRLHQINFGLQHDEGVSVVGGTLSDEDMLFWLRRLQVHLRLQRFRSEPPPAQALSTFEFPDGYIAVVRRWNTGGPLGRNDAMALIGQLSRLPLPVVLGLDRSFDWAQAAAQRPFQAWDAAGVQQLGDGAQGALREQAKEQPEFLRRALAQLLDAPERPLTIVGCPDEQRVPLLWGLHRLAARGLLEQNVRRSWTFSTYEVEDADPIRNLPSIVFLPGLPIGTAVSRRRIVDVRRDQKASHNSVWRAQQRVERFLVDREDEREFAVEREPETMTLLAGAPPDRGEPVYADWWDLTAVVDRILRAAGPISFDTGFRDLERTVSTPSHRAALRELLGPAGLFQIGALAVRFLRAEGDQRAFSRRLHDVVVGPERSDLRDRGVVEFALDFVQRGPPSTLGDTVLADLNAVHGSELINEKITERWLVERGLRPAEVPSVVARPTDHLFVSYAREDEPAARRIVGLLRTAGFTVWFDDDLRGGEEWWSQILRKIRNSTVVVVVVSDHASTSKPCQLELRYVDDLRLPVVPVRVGSLKDLRTSSVAQRQLVDFTAPDGEATARLVSAVFVARERWTPLPDPLPDEPDAPFAYLTRLRAEVEQDDLGRSAQRRILDELRERLYDESDEDVRKDICTVLEILGNHPEAGRLVMRDVEAALAEEAER